MRERGDLESASFQRLIREAARPKEPPDVWWAIALLVRARKLRGEAQVLAIVAVAMSLVRHGRLLDMAAGLLDGAAEKPRYMVLSAQAELAELRGECEKAKALRQLADTAPDAPTASEVLLSEWVSKEIRWRKTDPSREGRAARLDTVLRATQRARQPSKR